MECLKHLDLYRPYIETRSYKNILTIDSVSLAASVRQHTCAHAFACVRACLSVIACG